MFIQQLSLFIGNTPGRFASITGILKESGIDIRALSVADTTDFGVLRLIVNDPTAAVEALRARGLAVNLTDVIAICVDDRPGGLHEALQALSDGDVSVEYMYAFVSRNEGRAYVILRVDDNAKALSALRAKQVALLQSEDLYCM